MSNDNFLFPREKKRVYLDSSYSKTKLKGIFLPLEGEDEPDGSKMYIEESI